MPRLLLISYHFPPEPGVAAQRVGKLAKYLVRSGWEVEVLTATPGLEQDEDLAADVAGIATVRVAAPDSSTLQRAGWAMRILGPARRAAHRADVALISGGPFAPFALGPLLGVPYVLDFRDHWAAETRFGRMAPGPRGALRRGLEALAEHHAVARAAAVVTVAPELTANAAMRTARRAETIRHGFDPEDFEDDVAPAAQPTLAHVGSMRLRERTPETLLDVARAVRAEGVDLVVRLVGPVAREYEPFFDQPRGEGWLTLTGRLSHRAAVREMRAASALWIEPGEEQYLVTGKVYEHLAASTPVVARAASGGALATLLGATGGGIVVTPGRAASGVAAALAGDVPERDEDAIAALAHPRLAAQLGRILEESA